MTLPAITPAQMLSVEKLLTDELGVDPVVLIETAGVLIAEQARRMLNGSVAQRAVVTLVGTGQNGTDAMAAARRLAAWGAQSTVLLGRTRTQLPPATLVQLELAEHFGVRVFDPDALLPEADLIVDGLIGYGLQGPARDTVGELIHAVTRYRVPVLAVDVPSGLDATTGKADMPAIRADVTLVLAYPKTGLVKSFAANLVGELVVADLGVPSWVWQRLKLPAPNFATGPLVTLKREEAPAPSSPAVV